MTAEVKSVLVHGLHPATPSDDQYPDEGCNHFGFNAQVFIGEVGSDLVDSFDAVVCSPSWFAERAAEGVWDLFRRPALTSMPDAVSPGAGIWFMQHWHQEPFLQAISALCGEASPGPDWGTVAARIGEQLPWEYAYRHHERVNRDHNLPGPGRDRE